MYNIDMPYLLSTFRKIADTPSTVGYYREGNKVLEELAHGLGVDVTYDNRSTAYITLEGEDSSKTVMISAHMDTIGMIVRSVDNNGNIRVRMLGGVNFHSLEGESVVIITRDGRKYTGLVACLSHSVHAFEDARTMERDQDHMMILLDEKVSSAADVRALGIRNGDPIYAEPHVTVTESGFVKSRYIDDKAAVAICFAALKFVLQEGKKPKYNTVFAFPYSEEIGLGGTYVPDGVEEFVALDIGLVGPEYEGNEYSVSINAKDNGSVYDYELTSRIIDTAERIGCKYAVDIFFKYGTDANAAIRAGNNLKHAAFGMAVYCSHGMERTHIEGLQNTADLLLAYILGD